MHVVVVSLTDHAVWQFRNEFIANEMNVTVICPDGPYAQRIRAICAAHIPLSSNRFVGVDEDGQLVVMVSRIAKNKWILEFIEASASFTDQARKVRFVHIGPHEHGSLESVPKKMLQETATFLQVGYRTDIKEDLCAADLAMLPSYHREGIPNTLLEAAAMMRAIVTTDNVGCRETVIDGVSGLLVPVRDAAALTNAVQQLLENDKLRRMMGEAGFRWIQQRFTMEAGNRLILENVFGLQNAIIPNFYTEELNGKLRIVLDGQERFVKVPNW